MSGTTRFGLIAVSLLAATTLGGCVSRSDYDAVVSENTQLRQQVAQQSTQIARLQQAIVYTVESDTLFPSGGYQLSAAGRRIISSLSRKLAPTQQNHLTVKGYTDNEPIGPALQREGITSNEILSQKRAENVRDFLISQGVKPDLVDAKGFGENNPVAPNDTPEGRAKNRRVEFALTPL